MDVAHGVDAHLRPDLEADLPRERLLGAPVAVHEVRDRVADGADHPAGVLAQLADRDLVGGLDLSLGFFVVVSVSGGVIVPVAGAGLRRTRSVRRGRDLPRLILLVADPIRTAETQVVSGFPI